MMEKRHHQQVDIKNNDNDNDPNFDRKLDLVTEGAHPHLKDHLLNRITRENCKTIINYILALQHEVNNPSETYRISTIYKLKQLAEYYHPKSFKEMTRQDIVDFLDRLRKSEQSDPLHKWIGIYEITRMVLIRFFRWLYHPEVLHFIRPTQDVF